MSDLDYSRILCGVIRGALEMVMLEVDVVWKQGVFGRQCDLYISSS